MNNIQSEAKLPDIVDTSNLEHLKQLKEALQDSFERKTKRKLSVSSTDSGRNTPRSPGPRYLQLPSVILFNLIFLSYLDYCFKI